MNLLSPVRRAKRLFAENAAIHDFGHWAPKDALEIAAQIGEASGRGQGERRGRHVGGVKSTSTTGSAR